MEQEQNVVWRETSPGVATFTGRGLLQPRKETGQEYFCLLNCVGTKFEICYENPLSWNYELPEELRYRQSPLGNCIWLKEAVLEPGITGIAEKAFMSCVNLERVVIPATVTEISRRAFCGCCRLKKIEVDPQNEHYIVLAGRLVSKSDIQEILFDKDQPV